MTLNHKPTLSQLHGGLSGNIITCSSQVFHQRKEICIALVKISKICNDTNRRRSFEASYGTNRLSCDDVLKVNNSRTFCSASLIPNSTEIAARKDLTEFLFDYSRENFNVLKTFIKDPFYTR